MKLSVIILLSVYVSAQALSGAQEAALNAAKKRHDFSSIGQSRKSERLESRIVGGENADEGRYPYFASLDGGDCQDQDVGLECLNVTFEFLFTAAFNPGALSFSPQGVPCLTTCSKSECCACCGGGQPTTSAFCGGTLIAEDVVLTAAHCYSPPVAEFGIPAEPREVTIGVYNTTDETEVNEVFEVLTHVLHPGYNDGTLENDFMLLKINASSTFDPVVIDDGSCKEITVGTPLTVFGFGGTEGQGDPGDGDEQKFPTVLKEVDVGYITNKMCFEDSLYELDESIKICTNMMCAGGNGDVDSCQGDSGGPLIVKGATPADDVQVGIVSFGIGCAAKDYPGVYSRISNQFAFINNTVTDFGRSLTTLTSKPLTCLGSSFAAPEEDFCFVACSFPFECFKGAFIAAGVIFCVLVIVGMACIVRMCRRKKDIEAK